MWRARRTAIKEIREALGITQEDLGNKIGVKKQVICLWEKDGGMPKVDGVVKICNAVGANPLKFFEEI